MIERTKKGFSLVEVMLLFTVLAVFMAASMPVMTKKIKAIYLMLVFFMIMSNITFYHVIINLIISQMNQFLYWILAETL